MKIALILLAILLMAVCYEIGFCRGYEWFLEEYEKFVKGESDEKKDL